MRGSSSRGRRGRKDGGNGRRRDDRADEAKDDDAAPGVGEEEDDDDDGPHHRRRRGGEEHDGEGGTEARGGEDTVKTTRLCCLCPSIKGPPPSFLAAAYTPEVVKGKGVAAPPMGPFAGPFLPDRNGIATAWAHENCIMWCPEVYFDAKKGRLRKVETALKRGARLKCAHCDLRGATVGCTLER